MAHTFFELEDVPTVTSASISNGSCHGKSFIYKVCYCLVTERRSQKTTSHSGMYIPAFPGIQSQSSKYTGQIVSKI